MTTSESRQLRPVSIRGPEHDQNEKKFCYDSPLKLSAKITGRQGKKKAIVIHVTNFCLQRVTHITFAQIGGKKTTPRQGLLTPIRAAGRPPREST
jgi:hypothetical protein